MPLQLPEMFRTSFMLKVSTPAWNLHNQLKSRTAANTLKEIQEDKIIMEFAKPVLFFIQKTFLDNEAYRTSPLDPMLRSWQNSDVRRKNLQAKIKLESLISKTGENLAHQMMAIDQMIDGCATFPVQASWFKLEKSDFDNGPFVICFPQVVEEAVRFNIPFDPRPFMETPPSLPEIHAVEDDEFVVVSSSSLFPIEEETMETVEVIAVNE